MQEQYIETNRHGTKKYYKDKAKTILHREDGPAVEWADGEKAWYVNSKQHRIDGPAREYPNGRKDWWIDDIFIMTLDSKGEMLNRMR
jgi:hypothetical protein